MINTNKPLYNLIKKIKELGIPIKADDFTVKVSIELEKIDFIRVKPLLYYLVNKFEKTYFIIIEGLPYCLMPDAASHIIYSKNKNRNYLKTKDCLLCKYNDTCPGWPKDIKITKILRPCEIKDLPDEIVLEITQKCNLACPTCFGPKTQNEIPLGKIKNIIDKCVSLGIKTIRFTGGEPLLYKNIEKVLKYAKNKNLYVILNTNGTILDNKSRKMLKNYVDNVLISMQGFNYDSEKKLTKRNVDFKQKLKNIAELNYIVPITRIGTIISRTLMDNFRKYYYIIDRLDIKNWELYRPMTTSKDTEFMIERKDLVKLMVQFLGSLKKDDKEIKIANLVPYCITPDFSLSSYALRGCEGDDGHRRIVFDTRGFFKPIYAINKNLGTDIAKSWKSPFLTKIRSFSYLPEKCQKCFYLKWCKGGSRYWANAKYKDYFAPDPLMKNE